MIRKTVRKVASLVLLAICVVGVSSTPTPSVPETSGHLMAWGGNWAGQLGNGTFVVDDPEDGSPVKNPAPVSVLGMPDTVAMAGGHSFSIALRSDRTLWTWGSNWSGELGKGTVQPYAKSNLQDCSPAKVQGLNDGVAVAAGYGYAVVLRKDGTVWAWGDNEYGQLGDGTTQEKTLPVQVMNLSNVTAISACWRTTLALKKDGTVWAWGSNSDGILGKGKEVKKSLVPVLVAGLSNVVAVAAGQVHGLALRNDQTVWAWGTNVSGEVGNGSMGGKYKKPAEVKTLSKVKTVVAGRWHSLALMGDGTVRAWGHNWGGQLGDGTYTSKALPVKVKNLSDATAIACGNFHSLAVSGGTIYSWGDNEYGQLGHSENAWDARKPKPIQNLSGVVGLSGGGSHTLAMIQ